MVFDLLLWQENHNAITVQKTAIIFFISTGIFASEPMTLPEIDHVSFLVEHAQTFFAGEPQRQATSSPGVPFVMRWKNRDSNRSPSLTKRIAASGNEIVSRPVEVAVAPILSSLLLSSPNQNRHATQAISGSEYRRFECVREGE